MAVQIWPLFRPGDVPNNVINNKLHKHGTLAAFMVSTAAAGVSFGDVPNNVINNKTNGTYVNQV